MSWDKESVYDEQVNPLVTQIIAICKKHQIPFFATFQLNELCESTTYCTTTLSDYLHADHDLFDTLVQHAYQRGTFPAAFMITKEKKT